MKRLLLSIMSLLLITVMNLFALSAFASASSLPSAAHAMPGMEKSKTSTSCISLCVSTTSNKPRDDLETTDEDEDEEPRIPFYAVLHQPLIGLKIAHSTIAREVVKFEPPPGEPPYILFSVFRT